MDTQDNDTVVDPLAAQPVQETPFTPRVKTRAFPPPASRGGSRAAGKQRHLFIVAEERVSVAHISSSATGVTLHHYASTSADLTSLKTDGSEMIQAIDILLQDFPEKPKLADVVLPEDAVKKTVVSLPPIPPNKARKVLQNRALQVSGIPAEELVWTARPLGQVTTGEKTLSNWLIFTVSRPALLRYYDAFRNAGVRVQSFLPASSLLLNLSSVAESSDVFGEVILGDDLIVFSILAGGSTVFTRAIAFDASETGDERQEILAGELQRSFLYCQQNVTDASPTRVDLLHCDRSDGQVLGKVIEDQTGVPVAQVNLDFWMKRADAAKSIEVRDDCMMLILGAAILFANPKQASSENLLPKDIRPRNWSVSAKIATTLAIVEIGLIFFRLSGHIDKTLQQKEEILRAHQQSKRSLVPTLAALQEVEKRDQFMETLEYKSDELVPLEYDWIALFKDLSYLPAGEIHFSGIRVKTTDARTYVSGEGGVASSQWKVVIDLASPLAYRRAQEVIQEYVQNLRRSQFFNAVNVKPSSSADYQRTTLSEFTIECELHIKS